MSLEVKELMVVPQDYFTSAEMAQARNNIGTLGEDEVNGLLLPLYNDIEELSGNDAILSSQVNEVSGNLNLLSKSVDELVVGVNELSANLNTTNSNLNDVSENLNILSADVGYMRTDVNNLSADLNTTNGNLNAVSDNVDSISGNYAHKFNIVGNNYVSAEYKDNTITIGLSAYGQNSGQVKTSETDPKADYLINKIQSSDNSIIVEEVDNKVNIRIDTSDESSNTPALPFPKLLCNAQYNLANCSKYDESQGLCVATDWILPIDVDSGKIDSMEYFVGKNQNGDNDVYGAFAIYSNTINNFSSSVKVCESGLTKLDSYFSCEFENPIAVPKTDAEGNKYRFSWIVYTILPAVNSDTIMVSFNNNNIQLGDNSYDVISRVGMGTSTNQCYDSQHFPLSGWCPSTVCNVTFPYIQLNISKT